MFKFFSQIINVPHIHNLGDFYRIAGAIINRYHPPIHMKAKLAREMLEKSQTILSYFKTNNALGKCYPL